MLEIRDISFDFKIVCDKRLVDVCRDISFGGYTMVFAGKEIYFYGDCYDAGEWLRIPDSDIHSKTATIDLDVWDISKSDFHSIWALSVEDFMRLDEVKEIFMSDCRTEIKADEFKDISTAPYLDEMRIMLKVYDTESNKERDIKIQYTNDEYFDTCKFW